MTATRSGGDEGAPLRIAMVGSKGIPAVHGGIERHVDEIARRLARRGHHVDVFNRPYHPYRDREFDGVRIRRRPSLPTKHLDAGTHTALCMLEAICSRRYDVLHVHGIGPGAFIGWARPFLATVFTFHAQDYRQGKWGRLARWSLVHAEGAAVRRAHAVITVSQLLRQYVRTRYGREAFHIPNGAALVGPLGTERLAPWGLVSGRYVLFVGRPIRDRGLGALLAAWRSVPGPWRLVIVGDVQHEREHVEELRRAADERVLFTGQQTGDVLSQLYEHAAVCVHPSEVEGLPIAVLEAMAHGRAVLVSDIPENLEAVGEAAAQFPVRDAAALGAALGRLLAQPEERAALGARARARVRERFDWEAIAAATEGVYRAAVRARLRPSGARLDSLAPGGGGC